MIHSCIAMVYNPRLNQRRFLLAKNKSSLNEKLREAREHGYFLDSHFVASVR